MLGEAPLSCRRFDADRSPPPPNLTVSNDGKEVWFTLEDTGKVQIVSVEPPFRILATLDTGPIITNHVTLVDNANGKSLNSNA